ncbi:hypothetical protein BOVA514_5182 [Bacteroides ovatus]|nr:hypothetical protein BOVA514_5182 [Bacteroides ovatus]
MPVYGISVYKAKGLGNVDVFQPFVLSPKTVLCGNLRK